LEHVDSGAPWESERLEVTRKHDIDFFAGGHLFKFAPALGDWLAGVALGGDIPTFFQAGAPNAAFSRPLAGTASH
jgi:sarcosine oxidase